MPFYEYQCEKCSEIYELFIRNGEKVPDVCEVCGGRLHKIISVSSFQLKGSGWYMTDYAKKNSPSESHSNNGSAGNRKEAPGPSGDTTTSSKETGKETKPVKPKEGNAAPPK